MNYQNSFWYGSSYSPLVFPEKDWEDDLRLMAEAQMNIIRLGDVHGSWDKIEPQEGKFKFTLLEKFYRKAAEHEISIMISSGSASPPLWLARKHPDLAISSNKGLRYPLGSSYGWACIHHPDYLDALKKYIHELILFTRQQPNHFGWQLSNEVGFPFLPARGGGELDIYCYCDHCKKAFIDWVKNKYQSLDDVNQAWAWGTSFLVHQDWNDIFPPEGLPSGWVSVTKWLDWRLFWQEEFAKFIGWQAKIIRSIDHDHPISVNTFNFKGFDRFGSLMGLDQWNISKIVDHIGYDLYPGSGNKQATRPEHSSIFLDHGRSVAKYANTDFWLHEIESGPIGGWVMGPDHNTNEIDILRNGFEALGHDVKLMMYMPWREWDYQPLHWGALVDLDGKETKRLTAARKLGKFIQKYQDSIIHSHPLESEVAILESKVNAIFFQGIGQEENLFNAQRGAYKAFWDMGYDVDFIIPEQLSSAIKKYKFLVLPMIGLLGSKSASLLKDYVKDGGILIGFARCASLSENGWYNHEIPLPDLKDVFGIQTIEPDLLESPKITYNDQSFTGLWNRDVVSISKDTKILAAFEDQLPAVTLHHHQAGMGIYFATHSNAAYICLQDKLIQHVIKDLDVPSPYLTLDYESKTWRDVDPHLLFNENGGLLILANYRKNPVMVKASIKHPSKAITQTTQIFPEEKEIRLTSQNNNVSFTFEFSGEEVKVIKISF